MKKFLTIAVLIVVLVLSAIIYGKYYYTYSEGNRTGLLQKFSYKGNVFKTYEGELVLSSVQSTAGVGIASEKFLFSVDDKAVAEKMMQLEGHKIVAHYNQKHGTLPWRGDTPYIVDSVREEK
jgi:hypothetical protein